MSLTIEEINSVQKSILDWLNANQFGASATSAQISEFQSGLQAQPSTLTAIPLHGMCLAHLGARCWYLPHGGIPVDLAPLGIA